MTLPRDIVCISTNYWDGEWFRKQQFMLRFARAGHRVLYVEPSFSLVRPVRGRAYVSNRVTRSVLRRDESGVWVLTPHQMIPFVSRPWSSRLNAALLAAQVKRAMERLGFDDALLWTYPAEFAPAIDRVPHAALVFDIVDDLVAYEVRPERQEYVRACMDRMVETADVVTCTTRGLAETFCSSANVIPNGYDAALFDPATEPHPSLVDRGPVIGFVGTIFRYLDYGLLERIATEIADATLVLLGRLADDDPVLNRALALPNVVHVPPVARAEVPRYVAGFDVCIVPFRVDEVSRNVSPLKAYEYLAMGKPVVSVQMPSLADDPAARDIRFADSADGFVESVRAELLEASNRPLSHAIRDASWDGRFAAVQAAVGLQSHGAQE